MNLAMNLCTLSYHDAAETRPACRLNDFQQQKVMQFLQLVKWVVGPMIQSLPLANLDDQDLLHNGVLGLIDAVRRFDWDKENADAEFAPYALCRIRGEVVDELRRLDFLPRSTREKVTRFKKKVEDLRQGFVREPTDREIAASLNIDMESCHKLKASALDKRQVSLDDMDADSGVRENPEGVLHVKEVRQIIADEIGRLNEKERRVIALYYREEMTLREIGQALSVTESRVSQIHAQALERLGQRIRLHFGSEIFLSEEHV
ncbi:MAG: FliA/WhiG family RNA polymerase sigma factor [Elusimicrobia bacterium]|nr:FliA/WhiG family RNA polymerase sigma factor [Elusimicrobiota bacterium]